MSNHQLKTLWARVASDANFRVRFLREPLAAAACLGIALNATQVAAARDLHQQLTSIPQTRERADQSADEMPMGGSLPATIAMPRLLPLS